MTTRVDNKVTKLEWGVIVTLLLSLATTIFWGGFLYSQVANQADRIEKLETAQKDQDKFQGEVRERLGGIDAKLNFLISREAQTQ